EQGEGEGDETLMKGEGNQPLDHGVIRGVRAPSPTAVSRQRDARMLVLPVTIGHGRAAGRPSTNWAQLAADERSSHAGTYHVHGPATVDESERAARRRAERGWHPPRAGDREQDPDRCN